MLATAVQERRAGRTDAAITLFREIIARAGEQPVALNALGLHAMAQGDHAESAALLQRAIAADPHSPDLWMNLARTRREQRDDQGEEEALQGALSIDQRHFMANVRMAELLERRGDPSGAADRWSGVLAMAPLIEERSPALEILLERARDSVARQRETFAGAVDRGLAAARNGLESADLRRFDACIDHALGRRAIYANQCAGMHFPFLPADEFFPRAHFPFPAG